MSAAGGAEAVGAGTGGVAAKSLDPHATAWSDIASSTPETIRVVMHYLASIGSSAAILAGPAWPAHLRGGGSARQA
jgi:hypothetical protein